ncbi:hypothetical protein BVX99_03050 [bacterium F16]|nr:hypothetical protein BVX99_03050 [bacterium F16]
MMPGMDGHDVLKELRQLEKECALESDQCTKVIMITALDDNENILRSYTGRCAAYCVKPIDIDAFYNHLTELGLIKRMND